MSDAVTIYDVLGAIDARGERTGGPYSTRLETATELGVSRVEVDPVFDGAIELGYLTEDPRYKDYWALSDEGQTRLDELVFSPGPETKQASDADEENLASEEDGRETGTG